jgi:hypothetical protein
MTWGGTVRARRERTMTTRRWMIAAVASAGLLGSARAASADACDDCMIECLDSICEAEPYTCYGCGEDPGCWEYYLGFNPEDECQSWCYDDQQCDYSFCAPGSVALPYLLNDFRVQILTDYLYICYEPAEAEAWVPWYSPSLTEYNNDCIGACGAGCDENACQTATIALAPWFDDPTQQQRCRPVQKNLTCYSTSCCWYHDLCGRMLLPYGVIVNPFCHNLGIMYGCGPCAVSGFPGCSVGTPSTRVYTQYDEECCSTDCSAGCGTYNECGDYCGSCGGGGGGGSSCECYSDSDCGGGGWYCDGCYCEYDEETCGGGNQGLYSSGNGGGCSEWGGSSGCGYETHWWWDPEEHCECIYECFMCEQYGMYGYGAG